jgi:hypothetical protein
LQEKTLALLSFALSFLSSFWVDVLKETVALALNNLFRLAMKQKKEADIHSFSHINSAKKNSYQKKCQKKLNANWSSEKIKQCNPTKFFLSPHLWLQRLGCCHIS